MMASTKTLKARSQSSEARRRLKRVLSPDLVEVLGILEALEVDFPADPPVSVAAR
jgi:hypothetical protein